MIHATAENTKRVNFAVILQKSKLIFAIFVNNPLNLFRDLCHALDIFRLKER